MIFRSCQPWLVKTRLRPTLTDQPTTLFGENLQAGVAVLAARRQKEKRQVRSAQRLVREAGLKINVDHGDAGPAAAAAELMREAYEEQEREY